MPPMATKQTTPLRNKGAPWLKVRAQVLAEETTCHLCGQWVDQTIPHPHPRSPHVDHLLPVATHPHLQFERKNLRLAHRHCNLSRGTGEARKARNTRNTSRQW